MLQAASSMVSSVEAKVEMTEASLSLTSVCIKSIFFERIGVYN